MSERVGRDISTILAQAPRTPTWEERQAAARRAGRDPSQAPVHPEQLGRFLTGQDPLKPVTIIDGGQTTVVYKAM